MSIPMPKSTNVWSTWIENGKNIAQILALIVAAIWSYYTFVRPELFRPDDYRPHLHLETRLESMRTLPDRTIVTLIIQVSNKSRRFLHSLATHYELLGLRHVPGARALDIETIARELNDNPTTLRRWDILHRDRIHRISIGRVIPEQWWFAPGETYSIQIVAAVPCDTNLIQMNLSSRYDHSPSNLFHVEWTEEGGSLWYKTEVKVDGKFIPHLPDTVDEHRELEKKHGLQWTVSTTEIDLPHEFVNGKCQSRSLTQQGGSLP